MNATVDSILQRHLFRIETAIGRVLPPPAAKREPPLEENHRQHLLGHAKDLYWNELEWENLTDEELLDEGPLTELAFPGFLAFVKGLLLEEAMPDSLAEADPRPEVVGDVLRFLAERTLQIHGELDGKGEDPATSAEERASAQTNLTMTERLIDLVLFQLHGLAPSDVARVDRTPGGDAADRGH